jgi:hypothetical protein
MKTSTRACAVAAVLLGVAAVVHAEKDKSGGRQ